MKYRRIIIIIVLVLAALLGGLLPGALQRAGKQQAAITPPEDNLLSNWCFCDGSHFQNGVPQLIVADDWYLSYIDGEPFPGSDGPAYRPEAVVVDYYTVSPEDQETFFTLYGESHRYAQKIFKGNAPTYFTLWQDYDFEVGTEYELTAWVFPDFVQSYIGGKRWATDPWSGEVWLGTDTDGKWFAPGHGTLTYGEYNTIQYEFVADAEDEAVGVGAKGKWGLPNNGVWLWGVALTEQSEPTPIPTPTTPAGLIPADVFINTETDQVIIQPKE
jgi:hypothetical protein